MICKYCGEEIKVIEKTKTYKKYYIHTRKSPLALAFCLNKNGKFYLKKKGKICTAKPKKDVK